MAIMPGMGMPQGVSGGLLDGFLRTLKGGQMGSPMGAPQQAVMQPQGSTGAFGLSGTPRDILGFISDAWHGASGNGTPYAQARAQEQAQRARADALSRMATDPQAAYQMMAQTGDIDNAMAILENNQAARQQKIENDVSERELMMENLPIALNALGAATDEESLARLRPLVASRFQRLGLDPELLPTSMAEVEAMRRTTYDYGDEVDDERLARNVDSQIANRDNMMYNRDRDTGSKINRRAVQNEDTRNAMTNRTMRTGIQASRASERGTRGGSSGGSSSRGGGVSLAGAPAPSRIGDVLRANGEIVARGVNQRGRLVWERVD